MVLEVLTITKLLRVVFATGDPATKEYFVALSNSYQSYGLYADGDIKSMILIHYINKNLNT